MPKKYIVRLTEEERDTLNQILKKRGVAAQRVRRALMLLKADVEGPRGTDAKIAEAKIIALRLGHPPQGWANWTLRLLAEQAVTLEIVESVSYETLRRMLKKTTSRRARSRIG